MLNSFLKSPLVRVTVRYGAIAGVLCIGFIVSMYYMGKHPLLMNMFLDFRVPTFALLLFFALKEYREFYNEGVLYFWQGTAGSLLFLFTAGLVAAGGIMIFGSFESGFIPEYVRQFTEQVQRLPKDTVDQIGKDVIERNLRELPATKLSSLASLYAWQGLVIGFFISIIISVILRRQPLTPNENGRNS